MGIWDRYKGVKGYVIELVHGLVERISNSTFLQRFKNILSITYFLCNFPSLQFPTQYL